MEEKFIVLNGRFTAVVFSLVIHLVILLVLGLTPPSSLKTKADNKKVIKKPIIKSFLYKPAPIIQQPIIENVVNPAAKKNQTLEKLPVEFNKKLKKDDVPLPLLNSDKNIIKPELLKPEPANTKLKKVTEKTLADAIEVEQPSETASGKQLASKQLPFKQSSPTKSKYSSFNLLDQLKQLQNELDEKSIEQAVAEFRQFRSASVMTGKQIPVPHSVPLKNAEREREKNTTNYADGVSIVKHIDGKCSVETDLGSVGIEGVTSIQYFSCGESKFDKSFRHHMKKVLGKLGK